MEYRIAKLRFIDGMTYQEIADKLGYSYGYIRKVVSQGNNHACQVVIYLQMKKQAITNE
ncbi:sigma factor-like helix-turn-helix DNA-binding protein [Lysinibacillus sp. RC79]|uniref:sigma factor-like helix-turn-helix DNA-binding protein n=1 Tax=Lysinibacillus sp. RC79 TaxID=3156296 RepID=UPI003518A228